VPRVYFIASDSDIARAIILIEMRHPESSVRERSIAAAESEFLSRGIPRRNALRPAGIGLNAESRVSALRIGTAARPLSELAGLQRGREKLAPLLGENPARSTRRNAPSADVIVCRRIVLRLQKAVASGSRARAHTRTRVYAASIVSFVFAPAIKCRSEESFPDCPV